MNTDGHIKVSVTAIIS